MLTLRKSAGAACLLLIPGNATPILSSSFVNLEQVGLTLLNLSISYFVTDCDRPGG